MMIETAEEIYFKLLKGEYSLRDITDVKNRMNRVKIQGKVYYVISYTDITYEKGVGRILNVIAFDSDFFLIKILQTPTCCRCIKVGTVLDILVRSPERDWSNYVDTGRYTIERKGIIDGVVYDIKE